MSQEEKMNWHKTLINALWENIVITKKYISMSPFQLVYGVDTMFPPSIAVSVMEILQEV